MSGHHNSSKEFENIKIEDTMPVYEEITTMKTEVIEEYYDYGTLDDVEPYTISPYEQTPENDCYEQHITACKEENDVRLSGEGVAAKDDENYVCDKYSCFRKNKPKGEKQFRCETCARSFRRKPDLTKHIKIHDNKRPKFCCSYCKKSYYTNYDLQFHIDIKHTHREIKCGLCEYRTGYKNDLKQHKLIKHGNGDKLYKCKYCKYSADYRRNLQNHERTHSNVTLLKCTYKNCMHEQQCISSKEKSCHCDPCQFETAYGSNLRAHIKAKHKIKTERYTCALCTYSTYFKRYLRQHMHTHTKKESKKNTCTFCDYSSHVKQHLERHLLRIHANAKSVPSENC